MALGHSVIQHLTVLFYTKIRHRQTLA